LTRHYGVTVDICQVNRKQLKGGILPLPPKPYPIEDGISMESFVPATLPIKPSSTPEINPLTGAVSKFVPL